MPDFIATAAKAWVAGATAAVATAVPQIVETTNTFLTTVVAGAGTYALTWLVRNRKTS